MTDHEQRTDRGSQTGQRRLPPAPFNTVPIERVDVFNTVLARLEDWIQSADLKPGDRIPPERELASALSVSRTSLRQALKVLISMNRIEQRHGSGTFVKSAAKDPITSLILAEYPSLESLLFEVRDVRSAIDTLAVRLAASSMTNSDLEHLRRFLTQRESELKQDPAAPGSLDLRFEAEIAQSTGNHLLCRLQAAVHELHLRSWAARGVAPSDVFRLHQEHLLILEAMEGGDWTLASELMEIHTTRHGDVVLHAEMHAPERTIERRGE